MPEPSSSPRREVAIVASVTLVGAILRFWGPGHLGLNQFDEGIYALSGLWIQSPRGIAGINPEVVAYAPPLYPLLVGVSYLMLGVTDVSAILVSQVCGVLTIPAAAWVARRSFGPGAGAAAAALVALSGPHVAFSRMALTDTTFLLCWVLAMGFGGRFLERPGILRAIPIGLMVGLAQNAKYNGYLAGGIVAMAAVWGFILPSREGRRGAIRAMTFGLIAAAIAGLVYWPWVRFVEGQPGGYAGLIAHHRSYLGGPSAWAEHWRLQMGQAVALGGSLVRGMGWGGVAWPVAWLGGWFAGGGLNRGPRTRGAWARLRLGLLVGVVVLGCATTSPWWIALAMTPWLVSDPRPAVRVVGLGWLVMAILTPFYHPYARLWLPLHAAGWWVVAGLVADLGPTPAPWAIAAGSGRWRDGVLGRPRGIALAVACVVSLVVETTWEPRARTVGSPLDPSDGLRRACLNIEADLAALGPNPPSRLLLVARPAVAFYLASDLDIALVRQPDLGSASRVARRGDHLICDTAVGADAPIRAEAFWVDRFDLSAMLQFRVYDALPPSTTSLDLDPGGAFFHRDRAITALIRVPIVPR